MLIGKPPTYKHKKACLKLTDLFSIKNCPSVPHTFRDLPILYFEEDIIFERSLAIELSPVVTKAGCVLISNN